MHKSPKATVLGTSTAAIVLAILFQIPGVIPLNTPDNNFYYALFAIFFVLDLITLRYTYVFIRERRKRYQERTL